MKQWISKLASHIKHPYITILAFIIAIFIVEGFIEIEVKGHAPTWNLLLMIPFLVTNFYLAINPDKGAYIVCALFFITWPMPWINLTVPVLFTVWLALAYITYKNLHHGIAISIASIALLLGMAFLNSKLHCWNVPNAATMIIFLIVSAGIGAFIRRNEEQRITAVEYEHLQRNITVARSLHDHATNDLSSIVMLAQSLQHSHPELKASLQPITSMADDALMQTRQAILALEQPSTPTQVATTTSWQTFNTELTELLNTQQQHLATLGYHGHIVLNGQTEHLSDADQAMLLTFVRELFGNIAKYADPQEDYTLLVTFTDTACIIGCSDTPASPAATGNGLNSGLNYYQSQIEANHGSFKTMQTEDHWSLYTTINLTEENSDTSPSAT